MANIQSYLDQIANAVYGEEIRSSIINSLQKVNDDNDSYADLKKEVIAARDDINDQVDQFDKKMEVASEISKKLEEDTASGNQTHSDLTNSITTAQSERSKLESAYENVGKVVESANEKKDALDASLSSANTAKTNLDGSVTTATTTEKSLDETIQTSEQRKKNLDSSITSANKIFSNLNDAITSANNAKSNLTQVTDSADSAKTALDESTETAGTVQETLSATVNQAGALDTSLGEKIETGTQLKTDLVTSGEKAVQDIQAAGSEQLGKMQAVAEAFTADREQIATNKEDIGSLQEELGDIESKFEIETEAFSNRCSIIRNNTPNNFVGNQITGVKQYFYFGENAALTKIKMNIKASNDDTVVLEIATLDGNIIATAEKAVTTEYTDVVFDLENIVIKEPVSVFVYTKGTNLLSYGLYSTPYDDQSFSYIFPDGTRKSAFKIGTSEIPKPTASSNKQCLVLFFDYTSKIIKNISDSISQNIDTTLLKSGKAADAKVVGDKLSKLKEDLGDLNTSVFNIEESPNIFDKTKINKDKGLVTWGTPTMTNYTFDRAGWATSYPIAVRGGSTIHVYKFENGSIKNQDIANLITFTKDGSFIAIEGQGKNEIKLSENTAYIIFDISNLTLIDSLMLTTEPYNGVYQEYGRIKEDKIAKIAEDISKINSDKTHIIFSFDAFKIDNRFELMKSYGFPFTIAIAQTILTYPISKDDYYNYFIDGNVDFSVYAGKGNRPADYRSDKDKWSAWVKELVDGLKETSGLYYPVMYSCQNAASSDILNQVVKENGFRMCRNGTYYNADGTTTWGVLTDRKYLIDGTKYFDYYPLSVVKQESYPTVEQIKAEIDNAIEKKKSIMLFTHYVVDDTKTMSDTDCPLSKFTAVLDYVKEKVDAGLCDVKNARQFWNYYNQQDGSDIDYKRTNMRNLFDTTH